MTATVAAGVRRGDQPSVDRRSWKASSPFIRDRAEGVIAYDTEDLPAGPREFAMVFDLIGGRVHELSYRVLKPGGRLVYLDAAPFVDRASEIGVRLLNAPIRDDPTQLAGTMPLAQAAQAQAMIEASEVTRGRLVLTVPQ